MTTLQIISNTLADLYRARKGAQIQLDHFTADLEARKAAMVPAAGWLAEKEKATVDQRKQAAETAYAKDETCQKIATAISEVRDDLADLEGDIQALEVQSSAERWRIREVLAYAMRGMDVPEEKAAQDDPTTPAMDNHADELAQSGAESTIGAVDDPVSPDLPKPNIDDRSDIPF